MQNDKLRAVLEQIAATSMEEPGDAFSPLPDDYSRAQHYKWALDGIVQAAKEALASALQQQPEPVAQIDESKLPPRPAGHNGPDTDPDSPLVRYGRAKPESGVLLEPMEDGYWTPWHIANEMLRSALQHQEEPREPVAWLRDDGMKAMPADEKDAWIEAGQPEIAADYTIPLYASPSTTRQQEVGIFDKTGERINALAKEAGFHMEPMTNMLYTVRGNHAQLVNFARLVLAAAPSTPENGR